MASIELTEDEINKLVEMMAGASVPISHAEEALTLYKKFKDAKDI